MNILQIKTISQFHELLKLEPNSHPLITLLEDKDLEDMYQLADHLFDTRFTTDFYTIMFKDKMSGSLGYGRNSYDFQEGTMIFAGPGQVLTSPKKEDLESKSGWTLLFHPDLILGTPLSKNIDRYSFFSYEVFEALHLSKKEQEYVFSIVKKIKEEYSQNLDQHSQSLMVSNLELLLSYCVRFYDRQFFTRTNLNQNVVSKFEQELKGYFKSEKISKKGLPNSQYFGEVLHFSPNYLSDLLKKETGKSIKDHVDSYVVKEAKKILLNSNQTVSEVAYLLGYEYPQSFSRLFKKKVGVNPQEFRNLN